MLINLRPSSYFMGSNVNLWSFEVTEATVSRSVSRSSFFFFFFCQSRCSSVMTWQILTKLGGKDHWPCPNMSYDFDLRMTFDLDIGVKMWFFYKSLLLRQITCDDNMSWSCYLTLVSASGVCSVKESKVIKGSFPVKSPKILRKS